MGKKDADLWIEKVDNIFLKHGYKNKAKTLNDKRNEDFIAGKLLRTTISDEKENVKKDPKTKMKEIDYDRAKSMNITPTHWFVFFDDEQAREDFLNFARENNYKISMKIHDPRCYQHFLKVPINKEEDFITAANNGLSIWGWGYNSCNLMYTAKEFIKDYLEDEKRNEESKKTTIINA